MQEVYKTEIDRIGSYEKLLTIFEAQMGSRQQIVHKLATQDAEIIKMLERLLLKDEGQFQVILSYSDRVPVLERNYIADFLRKSTTDKEAVAAYELTEEKLSEYSVDKVKIVMLKLVQLLQSDRKMTQK